MLALLLRSPDPAPPANVASVPVAANRPFAVPPPTAAPTLASRPPIVLGGVVYQGKDNPHSQALLSVAGSALQVYRAGDLLTGGWSLRSIEPDHAFVANGEASVRLDIARAAATAAGADKTAAPAKEEPLPGFAPGAPPRMATRDAAASARNRDFLESVKEKRAAR